ncbi:hypothetical protein SAMN04488530_1673 [Asaccharospora irregularis DSM 2635]|uniref:Uncharacterized protein n=1 Tax=Asaccharospora irregularis DSM 2635 TaxID=1121321 RepID=A0A1M5TMZ2_9FIRM|nr:hypothetical protein SAMN04488530_1673 [Asaccharospora irregularis DSM 2635]
MKKDSAKIIDFQAYKNKKRQSEVDRSELLDLIRRIVTTK